MVKIFQILLIRLGKKLINNGVLWSKTPLAEKMQFIWRLIILECFNILDLLQWSCQNIFNFRSLDFREATLAVTMIHDLVTNRFVSFSSPQFSFPFSPLPFYCALLYFILLPAMRWLKEKNYTSVRRREHFGQYKCQYRGLVLPQWREFQQHRQSKNSASSAHVLYSCVLSQVIYNESRVSFFPQFLFLHWP